MTAIRTALVDATGAVTNVVLVDPATSWEPPEGQTAYQLTDDSQVGPGWTRTGTTFTPPTAPDPEPATALPTVLGLQAQIDELTDLVLGL